MSYLFHYFIPCIITTALQLILSSHLNYLQRFDANYFDICIIFKLYDYGLHLRLQIETALHRVTVITCHLLLA